MKFAVNNDYPRYAEFIRSLADGGFENNGTEIYNGRNSVKVFDAEGGIIVVKRYRRPHIINKIAYSFYRGSKARRGYTHALRLSELGIDTPVPYGWIEKRKGGIITYAYLATAYTDYPPVEEIIKKENFYSDPLFRKFVEFTFQLHEKGIRHDDLSLSNVLYRDNGDDEADFMLIDVNRMKFGKLSSDARLRNLVRLCVDEETARHIARIYAGLAGWNEEDTVDNLLYLTSKYRSKQDSKNKIKK